MLYFTLVDLQTCRIFRDDSARITVNVTEHWKQRHAQYVLKLLRSNINPMCSAYVK